MENEFIFYDSKYLETKMSNSWGGTQNKLWSIQIKQYYTIILTKLLFKITFPGSCSTETCPRDTLEEEGGMAKHVRTHISYLGNHNVE